MKILVFLALLGLHSSAAVIHSLKYFHTVSSQVPNFPEFVAVGMVDDVQISHYDSNTQKAEAKQDWMNRVTADDPQYWEGETGGLRGTQQIYKVNIETLKHRFNQTGGAHVFQRMVGCEWDDETEEVNGYTQYGYDGEDFLAFDLKTLTWIAPTPEAVITKHKWDNNKAWIAQTKNYLSQICVDWLKKYVNYGRSSLMRTELPSVSLFQKTPSSPVSCFATGFYPDRVTMFWRKDGEELHEDVELGEILPNHDGSFQMSVELKLSSVTPEDWRRYECVFQLAGVKDDIITKLDKTAIKTNWGKTGDGRHGVIHSLKYIYTGSSQVPNFPEFVMVGMVDDVQISHYDSNTRSLVPKQDWMNRITEDYPWYWDSETQIFNGYKQSFKGNIEVVKQRFNQTGGVHVFQWMYGCEWDDETGEVNGFNQYGYDGEDFVAFDLKTETWIAPKQQAVNTKHKWEHDKSWIPHLKNYLSQECPDYLKKYVKLGSSSLMRTDLPSVSLLQKTPSSPVSCFATGFYPNRANIFWRKDGEELHEEVELGEILPNHDGSFQMNVDLNLSSVTPEDWRRYECVFHLSGVKDDIIIKLDKAAIQTNWGKTGDGRDGGSSEFPVGLVVGGVVGPLLLAAVVAGILGYIRWGKGKGKGKDGFQPVKRAADASDTSSSSSSSTDLDTRSLDSENSSGTANSGRPLTKGKFK